jgi:hypothetical protein
LFSPPIDLFVVPPYQTGTVAAAAALATTGAFGVAPKPAEAAASKMWKPIKLPFEETLYDIDFDT